MKIFHVNSYYAKDKFYKHLYDGQLDSGIELDVYVPVPSNFKFTQFDYGCYTTISRNHNFLDRYFFHLKHSKIFKDLKQKYNLTNYSATHAHSLFSNGYIAMRIKEEFNIPYIVAVRSTDVNLFFEKIPYLRKLGQKILIESNRVVFLSDPYKNYLLDEFVPKNLKTMIEKKCVVIPNGIDKYWFDNIGTTKKSPSQHPLSLLHVGDISTRKNIETTVKAIDILISKGYKIHLDVVGKVKEQKVFNKISDRSYLSFYGYRSRNELIDFYRKNDIFVLPSIHETFGLVYAEAMTQGTPVIYSKNQGFDGQFENGQVGFSVECFDAEEIANNIIRIVNSYEEISRNCVELCEKFRWEPIVGEYTKIYSEVGKK